MTPKKYPIGSEHCGAVVVNYDPLTTPDHILRCPCQSTFARTGGAIADAVHRKVPLLCQGCQSERVRAVRATMPKTNRNTPMVEPRSDRVRQGIALLREGKISPSAIAAKLHVTVQTVRNWRLRWAAHLILEDENAKLRIENERLKKELTKIESKILKLFKEDD